MTELEKREKLNAKGVYRSDVLEMFKIPYDELSAGINIMYIPLKRMVYATELRVSNEHCSVGLVSYGDVILFSPTNSPQFLYHANPQERPQHMLGNYLKINLHYDVNIGWDKDRIFHGDLLVIVEGFEIDVNKFKSIKLQDVYTRGENIMTK